MAMNGILGLMGSNVNASLDGEVSTATVSRAVKWAS